MKICSKCGREQPESEFYKTVSGKLRSNCRSCEVERAREYRKNNPESVAKTKKAWNAANPERVSLHSMRAAAKRMGFDPDFIEQYYLSHDGLCEICSGEPNGHGRLVMDHCHATGKFRGFICSKCNMALGLLNDDVTILKQAIEYIGRSNGRS